MATQARSPPWGLPISSLKDHNNSIISEAVCQRDSYRKPECVEVKAKEPGWREWEQPTPEKQAENNTIERASFPRLLRFTCLTPSYPGIIKAKEKLQKGNQTLA